MFVNQYQDALKVRGLNLNDFAELEEICSSQMTHWCLRLVQAYPDSKDSIRTNLQNIVLTKLLIY